MAERVHLIPGQVEESDRLSIGSGNEVKVEAGNLLDGVGSLVFCQTLDAIWKVPQRQRPCQDCTHSLVYSIGSKLARGNKASVRRRRWHIWDELLDVRDDEANFESSLALQKLAT